MQFFSLNPRTSTLSTVYNSLPESKCDYKIWSSVIYNRSKISFELHNRWPIFKFVIDWYIYQLIVEGQKFCCPGFLLYKNTHVCKLEGLGFSFHMEHFSLKYEHSKYYELNTLVFVFFVCKNRWSRIWPAHYTTNLSKIVFHLSLTGF